MAKKLKILEICPFSAGICGVWTRVLSESLEFKKLGNNIEDIQVFSSNIVKGSHEYAESNEKINEIKVKRFKSKKSLFSANVNKFDFSRELEIFKPDIVITHLLHPHSFKAVNICRRKNIPCYLVTHAPFNVKRFFPLNFLTWLHRNTIVRKNINKFDKIIAVTKWELPYLEKLGVKKDKIVYIPNGIPEEFFTQKKTKLKKDVLFLGRIAPVKNLELILRVAKILPNLNFSIVGSPERRYLEKLKNILNKENIKNVKIFPPVYNLAEKIKLIDEHKIFILPSIREAMPQVLLEAMSRGKIILASKTDGSKEIISNNLNGFLFEIGDYKQLAKLILENISGNKKISLNAEKEAKKYSWEHLINLYPFINK